MRRRCHTLWHRHEGGCHDDRDVIAAPDLQSYLSSPEGEQDRETIGQRIFRAVQADALTDERSFVIPAAFAHHVEKTTPVDDEPGFTAWLDAYDEDDVTAAALLQLIKAQNFAGRSGGLPRAPDC